MDTEPEAPAAEPITIDFMNFSANEGGLLTLGLMKDLFEKDNPNIKINIETFGWDTYGTQLHVITSYSIHYTKLYESNPSACNSLKIDFRSSESAGFSSMVCGNNCC